MLHDFALLLFELGILLLGVCEFGCELLNVFNLNCDVIVQFSHLSGMLQVFLLDVVLHAIHFLLQTEDFLVDLLCTQESV